MTFRMYLTNYLSQYNIELLLSILLAIVLKEYSDKYFAYLIYRQDILRAAKRIVFIKMGF
jgi:hypothetical protein